MKFTIAPSADQSGTEFPHPVVTVETPPDGGCISEVVELVAGALVAFGYHPRSVAEAFYAFAVQRGVKND